MSLALQGLCLIMHWTQVHLSCQTQVASLRILTWSFDRRLKLLSLEGCSLVTIKGLESVLLSWRELQQLRVMSCNNIKDSEVTPELATLFSMLKELKWRPDSRSLLSSNLVGTGMGKKGGRFFQRSKDWWFFWTSCGGYKDCVIKQGCSLF